MEKQHISWEFSTHLNNLLFRVEAWLRYAEGKNAALLSFLVVVSTWLSASSPRPSCSSTLFVLSNALGWLLVAVPILLLLASFFPIRKLTISHQWSLRCLKRETHSDEDHNPFFFQHIAKLNFESYLKQLVARFDLKSDDLTEANRLLIKQIHINSRIASYKFDLFEYLFPIAMLGLLILLILNKI